MTDDKIISVEFRNQHGDPHYLESLDNLVSNFVEAGITEKDADTLVRRFAYRNANGWASLKVNDETAAALRRLVEYQQAKHRTQLGKDEANEMIGASIDAAKAEAERHIHVSKVNGVSLQEATLADIERHNGSTGRTY